jgi:hypothetical protein
VSSPGQNPIGCPPSFTTLPSGSPCPREPAAQCVYAEGVCGCESCRADGASGNQWSCASWPTPDGCPAARPRLGSPCATEGRVCGYGTACTISDGEPSMACNGGRWTIHPGDVPCALTQCGH